MQGKPVLWIVGTECPPEREQEFCDWYDRVHIPMLLRVPGVIGATRYEALNPVPGQPKYLTVYELASEAALELLPQTPEMQAARQEKRQSWGESGFTVLRKEYYRPVR